MPSARSLAALGCASLVMASLPPRRNPASSRISKESLTPLEILLQLGFPKIRAEKALAATGHRGVQLASDWLVAHVRDPTLDTEEPREYALYLCPTGALADELIKFWRDSQELGWNGAHNCMPHVTLVSFFKAPDEAAQQLASALESCVDGRDQPERIELERYVSKNFMGLFVDEKQAEWLKSVARRYAKRVSKIGIVAPEPQDAKSLHLTLAYQFSSGIFQALRSMVEGLGSSGACDSCDWELRLYSRDPRLREAHVHKVTHAHVPREQDELELRPGDYIYLPEGACGASVDGWIEGVSWLTGTRGYLPLNHTERTAESDSWTLHGTVRLIDSASELVTSEDRFPRVRQLPVLLDSSSTDVPDGIVPSELIEEIVSPSAAEPADGTTDEPEKQEDAMDAAREIFICRHGERVDFTFGAWIPYCFESDGRYVRRDLNMPKELPTRNIKDYQNDSPLTTVGEMQARLVGEAMRDSSVKINVAYASPSLRCVQTVSEMLRGFGRTDIPIRVEPGLIEWLAWYPNGLPNWMSPCELGESGFNVDASYAPIVGVEQLPTRENAAQYYARSNELVERMIDATAGNLLIVAHAASLAACTRQLVGGRIPPAAEVTRLVQRVPYLACLTARQHSDGWRLHPPPFPPITHTSNTRFDWKILV